MESESIEEKKDAENLNEDKKAKEGLEEDESKSRKKSSPKSRKIKKIPVQVIKKNNYFTRNNITHINYKDTKLLGHFVNKQGQIIPKTFVKFIYSNFIKYKWKILLSFNSSFKNYFFNQSFFQAF